MTCRKEATLDGFKHTLAAMPVGQIRRYFGTAHYDGARWFANIHGSLLDARWGDSVMPLQGGVIAVDVMKDAAGLASALVTTGYRDQPRPATGAVLAQGLTEVVFTGADGGSYATDWFIGTYSPGDLVLLSWAGDKPAVIGVVGQITQPPPVNLPPAEAPRASGQTALITAASDTWSSNGWGAWAKSVNGGEYVYTGSINGQSVTGSWFYGPPNPELAGKTITRVQFKVPARLSGVGNYNAPVIIYVYAHNSGSRPGSDVARVAGPQQIEIQPGSGGGFVDLDPGVFGPHIAAGGGISIAGGGYAGFNSRLKDPEAGKALLDWIS
jgi:hypothetical protein